MYDSENMSRINSINPYSLNMSDAGTISSTDQIFKYFYLKYF